MQRSLYKNEQIYLYNKYRYNFNFRTFVLQQAWIQGAVKGVRAPFKLKKSIPTYKKNRYPLMGMRLLQKMFLDPSLYDT